MSPHFFFSAHARLLRRIARWVRAAHRPTAPGAGTRRDWLSRGVALLLGIRALGAAPVVSLDAPAQTAVRGARAILSVRLWPAQAYTRLTLETNGPVTYKQFFVRQPERLVIDLEGVVLDDRLRTLAQQSLDRDTYIRQIRTGGLDGGRGVRLVLDLKAETRPQVFTLAPHGDYQHRLVIDLYPPDDPLLTLYREHEQRATTSESAFDAPSIVASPRPDVAEQNLANPTARAVPTAHNLPDHPLPRLQHGRVVTLDPGHGGEDPGAIGLRGTREKVIALAISRLLKGLLERSGLRVVLTREGDYFVPLGERVSIARKVGAELFVSIHADAFLRREARGSSIFTLSPSGASSASARWLAKTQNDSDLIGGVRVHSGEDPYLARTLIDLNQQATIADSRRFGRVALGEIAQVNKLHRDQLEEAGFAVLKAPDIPSILIETAFLSNAEEERRLNTPQFQQQIAQAIARSMVHFLKSHRPQPDPKPASAAIRTPQKKTPQKPLSKKTAR